MISAHNYRLSVLAVALLLSSSSLYAAPRANANDANAKMVAKLQGMVKDITAERDAAKAESAKITTDLEQAQTQVKTQTEQLDLLTKQLEQEKAAAIATADKLSGDLQLQKSSNDAVQGQLSNTKAQLNNAKEQYDALFKANQQLTNEYSRLQNTQKTTSNELNTCEAKNIKLYDTTKKMIEQYQSAQDKSLLDKVVESEPLFKFDDVATETLMQEYQDKINKQKYKDKTKTN